MKPTIALFLYDPKCSIQSGNGIIKALNEHYNFKIFGINPLEDNFFDDVDIVAVPGGFGDASSFNRAFRYTGDRIKQFIADGGYYLGICMGAYWAGKHYFDILDNVDAVQYLKQPNTDTHRPHAKNIKIEWLGEPMTMFWYDGCAFTGSGHYDTIAKYANNDPMAIIKDRIGLIGCHPESEKFWYDSYSWMQGKYHGGRHHELLLKFVDKLISKSI
jgi:glutamine amidotransferase-like uncharacterized protein